MIIKQFQSEGEWRDIRGSLLAIFELTTPKLTTTSSALGHLSRTHSAYDLTSLKSMADNQNLDIDDLKIIEKAIESHPSYS